MAEKKKNTSAETRVERVNDADERKKALAAALSYIEKEFGKGSIMRMGEGTQTGTVFRLRGKGIPVLNGRGRGDQYVTVNVETPRNLTKEQKEALRSFSDMLGESNYEKRKSFFKKK